MPTFNTYEAKFAFGEGVIIDGDPSIKAVVTAVVFRQGAILIEVSWIHEGKSQSERIEDYRLTKVPIYAK